MGRTVNLSKTASLKKNKIVFLHRVSLNAGQRHCRILQGEHSAILSTFIKLPFGIYSFGLSIFKWPLKTGSTVIRIKRIHTNGISTLQILSIDWS